MPLKYHKMTLNSTKTPKCTTLVTNKPRLCHFTKKTSHLTLPELKGIATEVKTVRGVGTSIERRVERLQWHTTLEVSSPSSKLYINSHKLILMFRNHPRLWSLHLAWGSLLRLESYPTHQPLNHSTTQPTNHSTHQHINPSTYQHINPPTQQHINHSTQQHTPQDHQKHHFNINSYQLHHKTKLQR